MNIEYKELSLVGKVWSLAELFNAGLRDGNKSYILAALKKLEEIKNDEVLMSSKAVGENTVDNIIENAKAMKAVIIDGEDAETDFEYDASVISSIWLNRIFLDGFKFKVRNNTLQMCDADEINKVYSAIRSLYVYEIKNKTLSGNERADIFKIMKEIEAVKIKFDKRVRNGQIDIVL